MLCIFTPTYNRAYTLTRLYSSLKRQTNHHFEWLIIDDGSSDNTEELIESFQQEDAIQIRYLKTKNGGKQRAHNLAVSQCNDALFLCVDSDDYLVPNAVESLLGKWREVEKLQDIAGVVFLKGWSTDTTLNGSLPEIDKVHLTDLYRRYRFKGDAGLMYRTEILKEHPFEVAPNEKFIGENYVYDQIDQNYMLAVLNETLYVAEYLPDGYTKNIRKITKENPLSYMALKKQSIIFDKRLVDKFKDTLLFLVGGMLGRQTHLISRAPNKVIAFLMYIPAVLVKHLVYR